MTASIVSLQKPRKGLEDVMAFKLPNLPFDRTALEPHMSAETLDFHHGKHHKAYVDKVNGMLAGHGTNDSSLVEIIRKADEVGDTVLFNNAAQIWNHSFFWQCLAPPGSTRLSGKLKRMVECDFGSADAMLAEISSRCAVHFGSGWVWLVLDNGKLKVMSGHDAGTPVVNALVPLLTLDVWEHAYYIDYRNDRPKFIKSVLDSLVNWDFVARNLDGLALASADQQPIALADT